MARKSMIGRLYAFAATIVFVTFNATALMAAEAESALPQPGFEVSTDRSDPARSTRRFGAPYGGDIIDMLTHVDPGQSGGRSKGKNADSVVDQIRDGGVKTAILMPTPNEGLNTNKEDGTDQKMRLARQNGDLVRAFCAGDYLSNWLADVQHNGYNNDDLQSKLNRLQRDLGDKSCSGLGEFGLMHFNKSGFQNVIDLRPTFPPVLAVIDVVAKQGTWIQVHAEAMEPSGTPHLAEAFGAIALWYQLHPDLKLILSHTGMINAVNARRLLTTYPNVVMTIKMVPRNDDWAHLEPIVNRRGELYDDWAKLMDDMPERFMIGTDSKFASDKHDSGNKYPETVAYFRKVLGSLSPDAADAIANGNARRLVVH
jgi:hypothetical protein